jgi:5-methylcytosine-specific restriction endonuclease McrA
MDHVLAASRGGKWEWENLVTACSSCNVKKGNKTLEEARMKLMKSPRVRSFVICDLSTCSKSIKEIICHDEVNFNGNVANG